MFKNGFFIPCHDPFYPQTPPSFFKGQQIEAKIP